MLMSLIWTTDDELTFLRGLLYGHATGPSHAHCENGWANKGANPEGFRKAAEVILSGYRVYDSTVDVGKVRSEVRKMLARMEKGQGASA
jgi:hypothetical protein